MSQRRRSVEARVSKDARLFHLSAGVFFEPDCVTRETRAPRAPQDTEILPPSSHDPTGESLTSLEIFFVNLFDFKSLFNAASYVVADHQFGELLTIDQNDALAEILCSLHSGRGKSGGRHK